MALMFLGVLVWVLSFSGVATANTYGDSAHGNTDPGYGVNRFTATCENWPGGECLIGDCAHCHDTFDPAVCGVNELMLFATQFTNQRGGLCMRCHSSGAYCEQNGNFITNYDYSRTWGGQTTKDCPDNIRMAFKFINHDTRLPQTNCDLAEPIGSAHDLKNIRSYMTDKWEWGNTIPEINPCGACHNPHQATRDYPCSLPSSHSETWDVWGDNPVGSGKNEKMTDCLDTGEIYQPPYQVGWTPEEPKYERDADTQPNYVEFCLECHQEPQNSLQHGTVRAIDWENADMGKGVASSFIEGCPLEAPYLQANEGQYVLCCTDCHEPHGSRNEWLLRTEVNGTIVEINEAGKWWNFCNACHGNYHSYVEPENVSCSGGSGEDACHQHFRAGFGF
jgi:hypothetical protein